MHKVTLKIEGKEIPVLEHGFHIYQPTNDDCRTTSITRGGTIDLKIESNSKTKIWEWGASDTDTKDGSVVYYSKTGAIQKELFFKEAACTHYAEKYDHNSKTPTVETFTISCKSLKLGDGEIVNKYDED